MDNINFIAIGLIVVVVFVALSFFGKKRQPKQRMFKCGRCSAVTTHMPRTIEAWRAGKTRFFCNACHGQWVRSHPARPDATTEVSNRSAKDLDRSGCLGILLLLILLPAVLVGGAWWIYV